MPFIVTVGFVVALTLLFLFVVKGSKAYTCPKCEKNFSWKQRGCLFTNFGTKRKVAPCPYCGIKLIYKKEPLVALLVFLLLLIILQILELANVIRCAIFGFIFIGLMLGIAFSFFTLRLEVFSEKTSVEKS